MAISFKLGQEDPQMSVGLGKKPLMPQYASASPSVNQANSDMMQGAVTISPSHDVFSGAKQGVEKIKSGILEKTGGADAVEGFDRTGQSTFADNTPTPADLVGKPQMGIQTGLDKSNRLINESAGIARRAQNPDSPDLDALRQAQVKQATAQTALAGFDPTKQPVSKLRKTAGIATGIMAGVLGGGPIGGIKAYDEITRKPALEQQQQLAREAAAAGVNVGTAEKTAQAADKFSNTQNDISKNLTEIGKIQQGEDIYNTTGRPKAEADIGLANAQAGKAVADTAVAMRPPEPKITNVPENDSAFKTSYDPKTGWNIEPLQAKPGDKGIQKLSAGDEPIVRGWLGKHSYDPNATLQKYKEGDGQASALVLQALHDEALARNPGMVFDSAQLIPRFDATGGMVGATLFDPRTRKMTPVSMAEMGGNEGDTIKTAPKPLDQTSNGQYKGAINTQKVVDGADGVISKLFPASKDPKVQEHAKQLREKLGAGMGRVTDLLVDKGGFDDPEVAGLYQELQSAAIFAASSHSGRITPAFIDEFKKSMGGVKQSPANLQSRLKIISEVADDVRKTIEDTNPHATQVAAQRILENRDNPIAVGKTIKLKDGTTGKISAVHPDGSFDLEEPAKPKVK